MSPRRETRTAAAPRRSRRCGAAVAGLPVKPKRAVNKKQPFARRDLPLCACGCEEYVYSKTSRYRAACLPETFTCPVCCEDEFRAESDVIHLPCGCAACKGCLGQRLNTQLDLTSVRETASLEIPCALQPGCDRRNIPQRVLFSLPAGKVLQRQIRTLHRLQSNPLYPREAQVACRNPQCLGLGYLGAETVMCFVCYDQYPAPPPSAAGSSDASEGKAKVKTCPSCKAPMQKDGGCDHMYCTRCHAGFNWSERKWLEIDTSAN